MSSEETPVEQPPATTEETPVTEDTPTTTPAVEDMPTATDDAPTTEDTPTTTETTEQAADDQPAVTDVTENLAEATPETKTEETGEVGDKKGKEEKKEEVKSKPKPKKVKAVVDYRSSKTGWVQKRGLLLKKWQRQYMSLDEEDSVLRWWKTEQRTGGDGALFMKYCADVSEPKAEATTTWPNDTADRCFVVCAPFRAYFLVAESPEEKSEWIQKLTAAKDKYNTEGHKLVSTSLISVGGIKSSFDKGAADTEKTLEKEGVTKKEEPAAAPTEGETAPAEPKTEGDEVVAVTVEVEVETTAEEPPKEETPAEEPPKEEAPKEEAPAEEPPKEETPAEEPPKEETPAVDAEQVTAES